MRPFIEAVRSSVSEKNWYAALSTALILPDICGRLQNPAKLSGVRYAEWFNTHMAIRYSHPDEDGGPHRQFLAGNDCYALRCAYLHEGGDDILSQSAREALQRFQFCVPPGNNTFHCNDRDGVLQLQVDIFCRDLADGAENWLDIIPPSDPAIATRMSGLLTIITARDTLGLLLK